MANYKIAQNARDDLERIWLYGLEHWGMAAADMYYTAFFDHFEQPLSYPAFYSHEGYRRSLCGSDSKSLIVSSL